MSRYFSKEHFTAFTFDSDTSILEHIGSATISGETDTIDNSALKDDFDTIAATKSRYSGEISLAADSEVTTDWHALMVGKVAKALTFTNGRGSLAGNFLVVKVDMTEDGASTESVSIKSTGEVTWTPTGAGA